MASHTLRSLVRDRIVFYSEVVKSTREVGAFTPTSRVVARAIAAPLADFPPPRRVLEVGAGTGALTGSILEALGAGDHLDVYEINPSFARVLTDKLARVRGPTVNVVCGDIEELPRSARYDVIVSSLPWLNLEPAKVERILALYEDRLKPGGVVSSWDYWANGVRLWLGPRRERERLRAVIDVLKRFQQRHEYRRRVIPWNLPPATVHWSRRS